MKKKRQPDQGFTIVELLIALLLSSMVMAGIWRTFHFQQQSYNLQRQKVAMEQNLRAGMQLMEMEIRMAGCDPSGQAGAGIVDDGDTGSESIHFTMDITDDANSGDYDGQTDDINEEVTYALEAETADKNWLVRKIPGSTQKVSEWIEDLTFQYLDSNGDATSNNSSVRSVVITLKARTADTSPTRTEELTTRIRCRNLGI
jgi:type IV pilus assembly protein PilW